MRVRGGGGDINYPETQNMIPRLKAKKGSVVIQPGGGGGGAIPWFFGYSVQPPGAGDTVIVDFGTFEALIRQPMILTETATPINSFAYFLKRPPKPSSIGTTKYNFALYDRDENLLCQTGEQVVPSVGGAYVVDLIGGAEAPYTFPPGEYFYAFCSNNCLLGLAFELTPEVWEILNNAGSESDPGFLPKAVTTLDFPTAWNDMPESLTGASWIAGSNYMPVGLFQDGDF